MRHQILALLAAGKTYSQIVAEVGCAKSTVAYHAKSVKPPPNYKVHDWAKVQAFYDAGHSGRQCMKEFGICHSTWHTASRNGKIILREDKPVPLEALMVQSKAVSRAHLRWRLLKSDVLDNKCAECGITEWQGKPLSLHLHHINGRNDDHRIENLQFLCPNCHSQTDTYSGRNSKNVHFASSE